jgi:flagellar assembly protein FliH
MPLDAQAADAAPRIVKAQAAGPLGTPVAFNYSDLRLACDIHLSDVREQSRRLVGDAAGEAEAIRRSAAEAGRKQGYEDGLRTAEAAVAARVDRLAAERLASHLETLLPAIHRLTDELRLEKDRCLARWEGDAIRLAIAVAEKLLHRSISTDPAAADRLIGETLRLAAGVPQLTIKLSPIDRERLGDSVESLVGAAGKFGAAEVVADKSITPGGCVVETRHGRIDGRLETQLERIASELIG